MEFCPKCGAILIEKRKNLGCPRCNYSSKEKAKIKLTETISEDDRKKQVSVLREKDAEVLPVVSATCKVCENDQAFFWTVQTRSGDEAETKFFKCKKCSHTWREYR